MTGFKENDSYPRIARDHVRFIQFWLIGKTDQIKLGTELSVLSIYRVTGSEDSV